MKVWLIVILAAAWLATVFLSNYYIVVRQQGTCDLPSRADLLRQQQRSIIPLEKPSLDSKSSPLEPSLTALSQAEISADEPRGELSDDIAGSHCTCSAKIPSPQDVVSAIEKRWLFLPQSLPILWMHIPKTGGTSLACYLKMQFPHEAWAHYWSKPNPRANLAVDVANKQCIFGHLPFGFHRWLTSHSFTYATVLRNPMERVLSHYYYHKYNVADPWHHVTLNRTLIEWVKISDFANNFQTQFLAGCGAWWNYYDYPMTMLPPRSRRNGYLQPRNLNVSEDIFALAVTNLEKYFGFIGLQGRYEETLVLMESSLGISDPLRSRWRWDAAEDLRCSHQKENSFRPSIESLTAEEIEIIRQYNQWDLMLFDIGAAVFNKQVEMFGGERKLQAEVHARRVRAEEYSAYRSQLQLERQRNEEVQPLSTVSGRRRSSRRLDSSRRSIVPTIIKQESHLLS